MSLNIFACSSRWATLTRSSGMLVAIFAAERLGRNVSRTPPVPSCFVVSLRALIPPLSSHSKDAPLSNHGMNQAKAVGAYFADTPITAVYASPLVSPQAHTRTSDRF